MNEYTNVAKVREYLSLGSQNVSDDQVFMRFIRHASRSIDRYCRRKFFPRLETRFYDYHDAWRVHLDEDLLQLNTLKTLNGACTVASSVMFLETGDGWNRPPYDKIVIRNNSGCVLNFSGTALRSNEVTGIWGYHEDYGGGGSVAIGGAWVDTGASLMVAYTASGNSFTIGGAGSNGTNASDVNGDHPRFAVGDTLAIGDEFFTVIGNAGTSSNSCPMVRGFVNGTTAANHAVGASIARFVPEPDIEWATIRMAAWLYGQKDTPYTTKTAFVTLGTIDIPSGLAVDVKDRINRFVRLTMQVTPRQGFPWSGGRPQRPGLKGLWEEN